MSAPKKSTRGGKREGAGRKKGEETVHLSVKILPATDAKIRALAQDKSIGKVIDELFTGL